MFIAKSISYTKDVASIYEKLFLKNNSILLESCDINSKQNTQSVIGCNCALKLIAINNGVEFHALNDNGEHLATSLTVSLSDDYGQKIKVVKHNSKFYTCTILKNDAFLDERQRLLQISQMSVVRTLLHLLKEESNILICATFAFDFIANYENLKCHSCDDFAPFTVYVFDSQLRFNHLKKEAILSLYDFNYSNNSAKDNRENLDLKCKTILDKLQQLYTNSEFKKINYKFENKLQQIFSNKLTLDCNDFKVDVSNSQFCKTVEKLKEHIKKGDIFQVVPSRTFSMACHDAFLSYKILSKLNPSPYLFYLQDDNYKIFGSSPEFALKVDAKSREVAISPIAGTRPRGFIHGKYNQNLDDRLELELKLDQKEIAEHIMLVDLARNDLSKICKSSTVHVKNLMHIDKYQSVQHLVSDVKGIIDDKYDALHAYVSAMNMGTLSGAPKIKAHELIYRYEKDSRRSYGGTIAMLGSDGSFDSCICIRQAFVKDNIAHVRAGCGVVYDSNPLKECNETFIKARSVLLALKTATYLTELKEV